MSQHTAGQTGNDDEEEEGTLNEYDQIAAELDVKIEDVDAGTDVEGEDEEDDQSIAEVEVEEPQSVASEHAKTETEEYTEEEGDEEAE